MPTYLSSFEVDWGWRDLSENERSIVLRYHAWLDRDPDVVSWPPLIEQLTKASLDLPGRVICARGTEPADDEDVAHEQFVVFHAGKHRIGTEAEFDPEGVIENPPPRVYRATSHDTIAYPFYFPEDMLEEISKEAMRQDRTLSWMAQKAWRIARDEIKKLPRAT